MKQHAIGVLVAFGLLGAHPAYADGAAQADAATAEMLFRDGLRLMKEGDYPQACSKLAESQRLDRGIGTGLYLGACYEKLGKVASAWAAFREAEDIARRADDGRAATAHDLAAKLESRLPTLTIRVPPEVRAKGLVIRRDGTEISAATWGVDAPVDAGDHLVEAAAPGKKPWSGHVIVEADGARASIVVGPLVDAPKPPSTFARISGAPFRIVGFSLLGVAGVGIGLGAAFGIMTIDKSGTLRDRCNDASVGCATNDPDAVALRDDASRAATTSTIAFVAGGAALAAGVVFLIAAPKDRIVPVALVPFGDGTTTGGVVAVGRF